MLLKPVVPTSLPGPTVQTVVLGRGQMLTVRAPGNGKDLSTTLIQSDSPLGVLSGHDDALIPDMGRIWPKCIDNLENPLMEQLRPTSSWTVDGHVTIPFYQTQSVPDDSLEGGKGAMFRVYTSAKSSTVLGSFSNGKTALGAATFPGVPAQFDSIVSPTHFAGASPVDVMMIGYYLGVDPTRTYPTFGYSAPMMTDIIPVTRWQKKSIWDIPINSFLRSGQFVNIIGYKLNNLKLYQNGTPFDYSHYVLATYAIPDYPDLQGMTLLMTHGSYAAFGDSTFIVYNYGRVNGQSKGATAYAAPCGYLNMVDPGFQRSYGLDSSCGRWNGFIQEHGATPLWVTGVSIITDSLTAAKQGLSLSSNVRLSSSPGKGDTSFVYVVQVMNTSNDAHATVYEQDFDGYHQLEVLDYTAPKLSLLNKIRLQGVYKGIDTCVSIRLVNNTLNAWSVDSLSQGSSGEFRISASIPGLPAKLAHGDTLSLKICCLPLNADTSMVDSMRLEVGCSTLSFPLSISTLSSHITWATPDTSVSTTCGTPDTFRVWLANTNPKNVQESIYSVDVAGADASEFSVVDNQFHYSPLSNFPINAGEQVWIDVAFTPDLTKPEPARWADRHAKLVATNSLHTDPEIALTAHVLHPILSSDQAFLDLGTVKIGATGQATITVRDTGNAPIIVQSVSIGNNKITFSGLNPGDTLLPGQSKTITLSGSSPVVDSISTQLTITSTPSCVNIVDIPVTFITYSGTTHNESALTAGGAFPPAFLCSRQTQPAVFTNTGEDTITVNNVSMAATHLRSRMDRNSRCLALTLRRIARSSSM